jgi:hypothetical protein
MTVPKKITQHKVKDATTRNKRPSGDTFRIGGVFRTHIQFGRGGFYEETDARSAPTCKTGITNLRYMYNDSMRLLYHLVMLRAQFL